MGSYTTIVVGTDGSATSFGAVDRAAELARDSGAQLVIACAYEPGKVDTAAQDALGDEDAYQVVGSAPAEDSVSRARDRALRAGATDIQTQAVQGKAPHMLERIVKERNADLCVVGNRGLNSLAGRLIGSVPQDIIRRMPVDVLIVHTTG